MNESSLPADEYENFDLPLDIIPELPPLLPGNPVIMPLMIPPSQPAPAPQQPVHVEQVASANSGPEDPTMDQNVKPFVKRALKSENAITGRGPKVLSSLTPVVIDDPPVGAEVDLNDPNTLSVSWKTIVEQYILRYDMVFLKLSAKAHLDSCDLGTYWWRLNPIG
jgi:hypothetical protein